MDSDPPLAIARLGASWLEEDDQSFWQCDALAVHEKLLRCRQARQGLWRQGI